MTFRLYRDRSRAGKKTRTSDWIILSFESLKAKLEVEGEVEGEVGHGGLTFELVVLHGFDVG